MSRIFNFTAADNNAAGPPAWAKKISKNVADFLFGDNGTHPVDDLRRTSTVSPNSQADNSAVAMPNMWRVHEDRKNMYRDIIRMDDEDELISSALDIIADTATNFVTDRGDNEISLRIITADAGAQKVIDDLVKRLDLHNDIWQIVRQMVMHGAYLPEILIDREQMKVVRMKPTITYQIYPKTTEKGDKIPGWIIREDKDIYNGAGQELEEWQICPFLFGARRGYLPIPMLASTRRNWQRLSKIEDGMAVARLTRAYDKLVHRIPIKKEWTTEEIMASIKRYREGITKKKLVSDTGAVQQTDSPFDVSTDFYLPDDGSGTGGITSLTGTNLQLGNLNDVYYSREKVLARLAVPIAYLQIMSTQKTHLKSGSVGDADIRFAAFLRRVHACLRTGLRRLIDLELMLNGHNPNTVQYKIELAEIKSKDPMEDAQIELTRAQAAIYFVEAFGALPPELLASKYLSLEPEQQKMLDTFLTTSGKTILAARIEGIKNEAKPAPAPGGGSGNKNKSKAKRSTEQKPSAQSDPTYSVDALTDLFVQLTDKVNDSLREAGMDIPDDAGWSRAVIRQNLSDMALNAQLQVA